MTVDCINWDFVIDLSKHPLGAPNKVTEHQGKTILYSILQKKNPAGQSQKTPGKIQKWACAAREARGARPFWGFPGIFDFFLGIVFSIPYFSD